MHIAMTHICIALCVYFLTVMKLSSFKMSVFLLMEAGKG